MKKLLFIFGTRPEAIKMAPLIETCKNNKNFDVKICLTGQHKEMLQQVLDFFKIKEDYNIDLMKPGQTLFDITSLGLKAIEKILTDFSPDLVLVQGDTTSAFSGALAAFYKKIKIAHIEAGLRSFRKYSPFPEEMNRKMITSLADFYFTPTSGNSENLSKENIHDNVFVVGNTVIDALLWGVKKVRSDNSYGKNFSFLDTSKKIILVTGHRRESFGKPFENICAALEEIAIRYPNIQIVYPVHLNPNVQKVVKSKLSLYSNIFLIAPVNYPELIWLMDVSYFIITDSGGIQEEAPTLGKPILIIREVTEREEGIEAGTAILVGTDKNKIISESVKLITNQEHYQSMAQSVNPYGSGDSSQQITSILSKLL